MHFEGFHWAQPMKTAAIMAYEPLYTYEKGTCNFLSVFILFYFSLLYFCSLFIKKVIPLALV